MLRNPIQLNKNPLGYLHNVRFGVLLCIDGLVRIISFGVLNTTFMIDYAREATRKSFERAKQTSGVKKC
jgi:hypothetical protein